MMDRTEALQAEIEKRKQAEVTLRETEQKLRNIIENSTNLFYMHGTDHVFMYMSPQSRRFFDCEPEEAMGRWTELITDNPLNRAAIEATQRLIDTGERQPPYVVECIGKKGRIIWVEVNESPIVEDGRTVAIVGSLTDITERKRAEEALRQSEGRFASFMLHMPAAAWIKDMQGRYVYANAEAERVFFTPLAALLGKTDRDLFPAETAQQFGENDCRVLSEGVSLQTTERLRQADGIEHHSIVTKFALANADGQPAYVAGVALDITERKRMEGELEHFASFPHLNPTPIIEMDADGRVTFCNRAAEKTLGKAACLDSSNPLIPRNLPEMLHDLRQNQVSHFSRTVEVGELVFDEIIYLAPQFNSVRIYALDVTERRRLEEERDRLAAIVENADDAIIAKSLDGIIIDWNKGAEKLYGYSAAEIKGRHISLLVPAGRVDEVARIIEKIARGENVEPFETIRVTKDGRSIPISLTISPIKDTSGKITGAASIAHDITARKRAEEKIEELNTNLAERAGELALANQELEAFNYSVAHDLRRPLTVVSGYCQVVKELCGNQFDEHCKEYLQQAYNGTLRMNRLIDALLKFSHLGHVELHREMVDLSTIAQVVAAEHKLAEPGRQVEFRIADGLSAYGDLNLLRVVLDNLFGNAWKYTGKRELAVIEFGVIEIEGEPAWFVRDNGEGFNMADAEKLFIPFQRLPGAAEFKGFGIGLATVERIIRRHGGKIWAEGEPGKGSTFYFTLQS
jgi:PAS domain S-box-containing protein